MLLDAGFFQDDYTFYDGAATSDLVPFSYPVALNGVEYMVDFNQPFYRQYRRQMASIIRTQADTSTDPGEQSLDPNGLWRRSFEDWSLGAGQRYLDRHDSLDNNFWQSKGIDCSTKWQISLLPTTTDSLAFTDTNPIVLNVGGTIYVSHGETLEFSTAYPYTSWTTVTGTPAVNAGSMATDGYNVWVVYGADGVYTTTQGASSASQYITSAVNSDAKVAFANGRLMLCSEGKLFNLTASGVLGTTGTGANPLIYTAGSANFRFNSWCSGLVCMYVSGNICSSANGDLLDGGLVYGITISSDGTTLEPPQIQGVLPNGETVASIYQYLDNLVILTSRGVRFCQIDSDGGISLGSLITTNSEYQGISNNTSIVMTGDGTLAYFPWANYDGTSTGIGALNLTYFVDSPVLPAYFSHLMATAQGMVTSIAYDLSGNLMFTVAGVGLFVQSTNLVTSGYVDSGYILYDLVDAKIATLIDVRSVGQLTYGSYQCLLSVDGGAFASLGVASAALDSPALSEFGINQSGERFEVRVVLNADPTTTTMGPVVTRWTLRSYPAPIRPLTWQLPLIIDESIINMSGSSEGFPPLTKLQYLEGLLNGQSLITFQEGEQQYQVFLSDCAFLPDTQTEDKTYFNGIALITLLGVPGGS